MEKVGITLIVIGYLISLMVFPIPTIIITFIAGGWWVYEHMI